MLVYRGPLYRNKDFFVRWPLSFFFFIFRDEDFFYIRDVFCLGYLLLTRIRDVKRRYLERNLEKISW